MARREGLRSLLRLARKRAPLQGTWLSPMFFFALSIVNSMPALFEFCLGREAIPASATFLSFPRDRQVFGCD